MDTWATSSLTPQIQSHWGIDPERHASLFPMDIRPQAHDIIRTWAFYTIVKAWMHEGEIPWHHVILSGLDPRSGPQEDVEIQGQRGDSGRSAGRVVVGRGPLLGGARPPRHRHRVRPRRLQGRQAARHQDLQRQPLRAHAARARRQPRCRDRRTSPSPSTWRWSRGCGSSSSRRRRPSRPSTTRPPCRSIEESFWHFCDHYLELVKLRSYSDDDTPGRRSALAALGLGLNAYLRLLAPFLPFVTDEVWSWRFAGDGPDCRASTPRRGRPRPSSNAVPSPRSKAASRPRSRS